MGHPVVHFEIIGSDGTALQAFYTQLFGWNSNWMEEMKYGVIDTNGGSGINGGVGTAQAGAEYATFYVEVPDPQAALDTIVSLGGAVVTPPTEIPGIVTFAQFTDPAGNLVGLVKDGPGQDGPGPSAGSGAPVAWFEALGPDGDALATFYGEAFGWKMEKMQIPPEMGVYYTTEAGGAPGISGGTGSSPDGAPHVVVYAKVTDLQATLEKAESLGGKVVLPPMDVPGDTVIAQFMDPQGHVFGAYTSPQ